MKLRPGRFIPLCSALLLAAACDNSSDTVTPPVVPPPVVPPPTARAWVVPDDAGPLTTAHVTAFTAGNLYFNAHTPTNPGGEIRGQLDKGGTVKLASLNGAQETPPVTSTALGAGLLEVDEISGAVRGFVLTPGLTTATAAHIHVSSGRGVGGAIILPLAGGPELWVVPDDAGPLTTSHVTAFQAGNLYFNVHTPANPGGEIRGQIDKQGTVKLASLSGAQEAPAVTSSGFGYGVLAVDAGPGSVAGFLYTSGLVSPSAAHVHLSAGRGVGGGIAVPLIGGPNLWVVPDTVAALTGPQVTGFTAGNLYYNAHTPANPGGEIRGQLDKQGTIKVATLGGSQETPAVTTTAFGAAVLAVDAGPRSVAGFLHTFGLVSPTAAHVHASSGRGVSAGVILPLTP